MITFVCVSTSPGPPRPPFGGTSCSQLITEKQSNDKDIMMMPVSIVHDCIKCACVYVCACACVRACNKLCQCLRWDRMSVRVCVRARARARACVCVRVCACVCMCVCVLVRVCVYVCVCDLQFRSAVFCLFY